MIHNQEFIHGGIFFTSLAIALFFFGYWRKSGDELFLFFSISFIALAVERLIIAFVIWEGEFHYCIYLIRLFAYSLIALGIVRKNRSEG